eukprot:scaffold78081_cov12-Tisochrysis_lutea.AAC.2
MQGLMMTGLAPAVGIPGKRPRAQTNSLIEPGVMAVTSSNFLHSGSGGQSLAIFCKNKALIEGGSLMDHCFKGTGLKVHLR